MKKWLALVLSLILISNITILKAGTAYGEEETDKIEIPADLLIEDPSDFSGMDDPALLQYIEDEIAGTLDANFADNESVYQIEDVTAIYISKEYLEELEYNSKSNIFFGYTLEEIDAAFQGEKYIFSLSDSGETVVQEYVEMPNDTFNRILKNVLIGSGVILVCVTVSVATAGAAASAMTTGGSAITSLLTTSTVTTAAKVHMIFAVSAHSAASAAASGTLFAGATTLVARGFETGWDVNTMTENALVGASEGYKWGAISGAVTGGAKEALRIIRPGKKVPTPEQAERRAMEKYSQNGPVEEQVSFYRGKRVSKLTPGATRPDIVAGNEAIEVKCCNLGSENGLKSLITTLKREIGQRVVDLPEGMTQRIVLNVEGRGYSSIHVNRVINWIQAELNPIYPDIPIDVMGGVI